MRIAHRTARARQRIISSWQSAQRPPVGGELHGVDHAHGIHGQPIVSRDTKEVGDGDAIQVRGVPAQAAVLWGARHQEGALVR
jgi:hypothetical protein